MSSLGIFDSLTILFENWLSRQSSKKKFSNKKKSNIFNGNITHKRRNSALSANNVVLMNKNNHFNTDCQSHRFSTVSVSSDTMVNINGDIHSNFTSLNSMLYLKNLNCVNDNNLNGNITNRNIINKNNTICMDSAKNSMSDDDDIINFIQLEPIDYTFFIAEK
ncbi:hypothetical protein K502DRAFT_331919 [Neoconidiobolus thromboides FSU 785]|nr:hypothetical protein K502DRAFT_331919 [Neoconidiobolus thromboides FSU 785]